MICHQWQSYVRKTRQCSAKQREENSFSEFHVFKGVVDCLVKGKFYGNGDFLTKKKRNMRKCMGKPTVLVNIKSCTCKNMPAGCEFGLRPYSAAVTTYSGKRSSKPQAAETGLSVRNDTLCTC